jgi:gas vesicle protein
VKSIGQTFDEATVGGVVGGAVIGSLIAPGIGTVVGAGIGAVMALLNAESLQSMQERIRRQVFDEIDAGVHQLDARILAWMKHEEERYLREATESFVTNATNVTRFLMSNCKEAKRLAHEARLLLPPPSGR